MKKTFLITKVISDTQVQVDNVEDCEYLNIDEKFKVTPKIDQKDLFDNTWRLLKNGEVVGIFPEVTRRLI